MPLPIGKGMKNSPAVIQSWKLLLALMITTLTVNFALANPTIISDVLGTIPPDSNTKPPVISVFAPENQTVYAVDLIPFSFNVSVGESTTASSKYIGEIQYKADWQEDNVTIYEYNPTGDIYSNEQLITNLSKTLNLTGIPEGSHSLSVYVEERGAYYDHTVYDGNVWYEYYYLFKIHSFLSVFFKVDTDIPHIAILSMRDKTVYSSSVDLSFAVNEPVSRCVYSLDGYDNVTIVGNTTLTGLSVGEHRIRVYAWDAAGHIGVSETITFVIAESFPTILVLGAIVAAVVVGLGLLVYFTHVKRSKRSN
jgi:hypothetical protein